MGLVNDLLDAAKVDKGTSTSKLLERAAEAIERLEEQEDETTFVEGKYYEPMCEKCRFSPFVGYIPTIEWMKQHGYKRCPHCGRAVKWDDV